METLSIKALTLGFGIHWAIVMLVIGWGSMFGWGDRVVEVVSSFYIGFDASFLGGVIGALWGFVGGAIGGAMVAFIYNVIAKRH